jgi:universal stress protein E
MSQLNSILVGVDFSEGSEAALRQAMRIGAFTQAKVSVVHVVETLLTISLTETVSVMQESITEGLKDEGRQRWKAFSGAIPGAAGLPFDVEVNSATAALSRRVEEAGAGLLAMGARGAHVKSGVGPVAAACVRYAPCDVLLVQGTHHEGFKTIVVGVDFSDTALRAVDQAVRMAARDGATLYIVHAFTAPWKHSYLLNKGATPDLDSKYREVMLARLEEFCKPFAHEMAYLKPRYQLIEAGNHGRGVGEFARQIGAELVVLGTRGRTNLRDIVLGSTAERILQEAPCSTLAVKPRKG